jgi:hypothetical protein
MPLLKHNKLKNVANDLNGVIAHCTTAMGKLAETALKEAKGGKMIKLRLRLRLKCR